jgi:hypothetical protein
MSVLAAHRLAKLQVDDRAIFNRSWKKKMLSKT